MSAEPSVGLGTAEHPTEEYRALSPLAVVSLIVGLLSCTALLAPIFWIVPLLGAGLALLAIHQIRRNASTLTGRALAVIGLACCLIFGPWALTQHYLRQQTLAGYAHPYATGWLERIQEGRLQEAHQMYLQPSLRQPPGTDLRRFYEENAKSRDDLKAMFEAPTLRPLVEHGAAGELTYEGVAGVARNEGLDYVLLHYRFTWPEGEGRESLDLLVEMRRTYDPEEKLALWTLHDVQPLRRAS